MQNEQEEEPEIEVVMSDIEEEVSTVDFVDEARELEQPKIILMKKTKTLEYLWSHLLVNVG